MLIFLIGFMGCGKSYTGRHLAPLLGYDFIDTDHLIENNEGIPIKEIFETKGEQYFRTKEQEFLQTLQPEQNLVISTGGGLPCFFDNMDVMNKIGITIYLNRSKTKVIERLIKGQQKRPLLTGLLPEEIASFYDEKLKTRSPFYEKAKIHAGDADVDEIINGIQNLNLIN